MNVVRQRFTPAEALGHPKLGLVSRDYLQISDEELARAVLWFQRLCGLDESSPRELVEASREDVCEDAELLVMLLATRPTAFRAWFATDDYSIFSMIEVTGDERWAQRVLARCLNRVK